MRVSNETYRCNTEKLLGRSQILLLGFCLMLISFIGIWVYFFFGHDLIRSIYNNEIPWLSDLIKRQSEHSVEYYVEIADHAVKNLAILAALMFIMFAGLQEWCRRHTNSFATCTIWRRMLLMTGTVWLIYLLKIPVFQILPYWFWSLNNKPLPYWILLVPILTITIAVSYLVLRRPYRKTSNMLLLITLCYCLQLGFGLMEGRGMRSLSNRLTDTGGNARIAHTGTQWSANHLLQSYSSMVQSGELTQFPHATKPPGPVIVFAVLNQISAYLHIEGNTRPEALANFAVWVLPLIASLTLLPLWGLCYIAFSDQKERWLPLVLYISVPSILLIVPPFDQNLLPFVSTTCIYLMARAMTGGSILLAFTCGGIFYLSLFISFGLITIACIIAVLAFFFATSNPSWFKQAKNCSAVVAGTITAHFCAFFLFGYDALSQFRLGISAHQTFKFADWGLLHTIYFGALNMVEFGLWCGPSLAILCGVQLYRICKRLPPRENVDTIVLALGVVMVGLALFGHTAGETARLWIFLIPFVCFSGARCLVTMKADSMLPVLSVITLQLGTVMIIKSFQDFF